MLACLLKQTMTNSWFTEYGCMQLPDHRLFSEKMRGGVGSGILALTYRHLVFSFNRGCVCSPHTTSLFALVRAKTSHPAVSKHLLESPLYKSLIRVPVSTQGRSAQSRALHTGSNHLATEAGGFSLRQSQQMRNLDRLIIIITHRGSSLTG